MTTTTTTTTPVQTVLTMRSCAQAPQAPHRDTAVDLVNCSVSDLAAAFARARVAVDAARREADRTTARVDVRISFRSIR